MSANTDTKKFINEHRTLVFVMFWVLYIFITFQLGRLSETSYDNLSQEEMWRLEEAGHFPDDCFNPPLCR